MVHVLTEASQFTNCSRPEQSIVAAGQAHVYCYVVLSPVTSHDLTHKASALVDPVVFHDPHPHTGTRMLGDHTRCSISSTFSAGEFYRDRARSSLPSSLSM